MSKDHFVVYFAFWGLYFYNFGNVFYIFYSPFIFHTLESQFISYGEVVRVLPVMKVGVGCLFSEIFIMFTVLW